MCDFYVITPEKKRMGAFLAVVRCGGRCYLGTVVVSLVMFLPWRRHAQVFCLVVLIFFFYVVFCFWARPADPVAPSLPLVIFRIT